MESYVLVFVMFLGPHKEPHARGISSERSCWQLVDLMNKGGMDYIGVCVTEREYRRRWPDLRMDRDS